MATKNVRSSINRKGIGDAAVDGLLAGVAAGIVMILFLLAAGLITRDSPVMVLGRFDLQAASRPVVGLLTHIAISAIYGLFFGVLFVALVRIRPALLRWSWFAGLVYGLILYGIAQAAFMAGANSGLVQFSSIILLLAHLIYGLIIGGVIQRKWRKDMV